VLQELPNTKIDVFQTKISGSDSSLSYLRTRDLGFSKSRLFLSLSDESDVAESASNLKKSVFT
jgi:hypothetical protein